MNTYVYRASVTIPSTAAAGAWSWSLFPLRDPLGNSGSFGPPGNYSRTITVVRGATSDTSAPVLTAWNLLNTTADLTSGSATVSVEFTVTDATGVSTPSLTLASATTTQSTGFATISLISSSGNTYVYRASVAIPSTAAAGAWSWSLFPLRDSIGNSGSFGPPNSYPRTVTVVRGTTGLIAIVTQPFSQSASSGTTVRLTVVASGAGTLSYQWLKNGTPIAGATNSTLTLPNVQSADVASYTVTVTNVAGSVTSNAATLTLVAPRISGVSVRTTLAAEQILIVGVNVAGGSKPALIRAAGPGLGALGVPGTMANPRLALFNGQTQVAANDDWAGNAAVASAISAPGGLPVSLCRQPRRRARQ